MSSLLVQRGASFSTCRRYRYTLWRTWNAEQPPATFIMLNPSTADEDMNDPTVERCERRSVAMGYGGLVVLNLFALRSTNPNELLRDADPVGPDNDRAIASIGAGLVVCAWGAHPVVRTRGRDVLRLLIERGLDPYCLRLNRDGSPKHPLYVPYDARPFRMT